MMTNRLGLALSCSVMLPAMLWATGAQAQTLGPYNVEVASGGSAFASRIDAGAAPLVLNTRNGDWTLRAWMSPQTIAPGVVRVAGFGERATGPYLALVDGRPALLTPAGTVTARAPATAGRWTLVVASVERGQARLIVNGVEVARGPATLGEGVAGVAHVGSEDGAASRFGGRVADFRFLDTAVPVTTARRDAREKPDDALIVFTPASPNWPVQVKQMYGQVAPQDAWTLPKSAAPFDKPAAKPIVATPPLSPVAEGRWAVGGWRLAEAPSVTADGASLSRAGYDAKGWWYAATVPGTVLTTLVDRGVYPSPEHGLNNLAIPEKLARQDYWYRTEFDAPAGAKGRRMLLDFKGVNYAAEVWVNGVTVGRMKGAFIRGRFDVTDRLAPGRNAVAVRVSPPRAGITHEESLTAGVGENGGMGMLDGPTFGAAEGWDWIPTIRDRNTGLWQGVDLLASGDVRLGDAQIVTTLPRADNSVADVTIDVPVTNLSTRPITTTVRAGFDDVRVEKQVALAPGASATVHFAPSEFAQLSVANPKLWWPNGYGDPALHTLHLSAVLGGTASDEKDVRFGMRQVTYELSLMDGAGKLDRVGLDFSKDLHHRVVDHRHEAIRQVPNGWAYSFAPGAQASPAVTPIIGDEGMSPYLVIRVNGVRIAARGGNIGMDDFMKRTERTRLEPFFRLHRDAHLNIIRNWVGQNTEDVFYDLADEYGLMVLNDFWESTQDYNVEAEDVPLFVANAQDVIRRYRNHPSIVVWFGRNEGVPQPILNEALEATIDREDGTRLYMPSSNRISLANSGPYNWRQPAEYFTEHAKGFAVELGTPSFPTLESWKRAIPASELWPISDSWAYHDWHQTGNGAVAGYMNAMRDQFGTATGLEDFERKAQMLEYVSYRAIFEGFNAGLWKTNSARMLWMTQPAWPSSAWQIFSSDYDTHAAFYGVKKASEPAHVQMNLPDYKVIVVNNGRAALSGATVRARVTTLDNRLLAERQGAVSAGAGLTADAFTLDLAPLLASSGAAIVSLELVDASGTGLSRNVYWQGRDDAAYRRLGAMPQVALTARATSTSAADERVTSVALSNGGKTAALATKLTLFDSGGRQVLPAYFSDNYVSLMPGESRTIEVRYPASAAKGAVRVALRGWNVQPSSVTAR